MEEVVTGQIAQFYPFSHVRYCCNGSDPLAASVKLARAWTGRSRILSFGYHGTCSAFCPGPNDPTRPGLGDFPRNLGTLQAERDAYVPIEWCGPFVAHFKEDSDNLPAMVVVECPPVDGGREQASTWLKNLSALCHRYSTLFVLDEVVTGFRYGPDGAMGYYGLTPDDVDLLAIGKTLGNGFPVSALLGRGDVMQQLAGTEKGQVHWSGTFGGEPTGMAIASAFLRQLNEDSPWDNLYYVGEYLCEEWNYLDIPWKLDGHPTRPVIWPEPDEDDQNWLDLRRYLLRRGHVVVSHPWYVCTETKHEDVRSLCTAVQLWLNSRKDKKNDVTVA